MERLQSELKRSIERNETVRGLLRACIVLAAMTTVAGGSSVLLLLATGSGPLPADNENTAQQGAQHDHK
jgi:hypothetical protein